MKHRKVGHFPDNFSALSQQAVSPVYQAAAQLDPNGMSDIPFESSMQLW
jgi:hypothetical protein